MGKRKFEVGDSARIDGMGGRRAEGYPWLRSGRIVKIKAVVPNVHWLGRRHTAYIVQGRRGKPDAWLASYELRTIDQRSPRGRKAK